MTLQSSAAARLLRRRRRVRAEEHHLGRRARPRGGGLDRQAPARRGRHAAPAPGVDADLAEDGHPRVELRQRHHRPTCATRCRGATSNQSLRNIKVEVELGFDVATAWKEAQRCLNCDVQTVFNTEPVHRVRRLRRHLPDGLHHLHRATATRPTCARACTRRRATPTQALYVSGDLKTGRVMVKDEDVCLHCGLCAERCPTGAWDMQKFMLEQTRAGTAAAAAPRATAKVAALHERRMRRRARAADRGRQRLRRQVRQRQRLGLGLGQRAVRAKPSCAWACRSARATSSRRTSRACRPGTRCASARRGYLGRRGGVDLMVAMNPQTWDTDLAEIEPGGYLFYDSSQAAAAVEVPRRHPRDRRAAHRALRHAATPTRASASCSRTSSTSARWRRCSASSPR